MWPIGDLEERVRRLHFMSREILINRFARAACLADFHVNLPNNLERLRVDTRGDFDWRVPRHLPFVLFDFEACPNRARFDARIRSGLAAKWSKQTIVGRPIQIDLRGARAAGWLR